ncbi:MAG: voltage-gated potassium channel [Sphingomonadales bacterium]|nr:voltage-gated potassium channel [Sphingomonadales bacterium]
MSEKTKQILFFVLPILGQLLLTVLAYFGSRIYVEIPLLAYVNALLMALPAVLAIVMLIRHKWENEWVIVSLAVQSAMLITHFAIVHHVIGLGPPGTADSFWDALYFSIVTWTTLGYGDVNPVHELRMFAAIEALYGYIFLGLIVGVLSTLFKGPARGP